MKKITVIILLLVAFISNAQDVSMTKSAIFKDSKKYSFLKFSLEDENGGLITIREFYGGVIPKLKGYYIQHFDSKLKLLKETEFKVDVNMIKNAFVKDGKLHLIEYVLDKKTNKNSFNAVSADLKTLKFNSKEILSLSEENQKKYFGFTIFPILSSNFSHNDRYYAGEVVMSSGNNYFVINFDINNKEKETHKVFVFNNNFEKVYEQLIQKNIKDKYFDYESIDIDDKDGTVYFLGKSFENESRRSKKDGEANYHFELYKASANGQSNVSFKNPDKFISSLKLIKTENRVACVGFYGKRDEDRINGACLFNLDPESLTVQNKNFTPFSEEFLTDKYGNKEGKKKRKEKKGIENIIYKSIHMLDNGDLIINAEEFFITEHTVVNSFGGQSIRYVKHYNDIMSLKMNKNGDLIWARNIKKRQSIPDTSSFTSISVGDDSYFFINCSDKISKLSANRIGFKQTRKMEKSNLYMIKINKDGDFDFKKLIDDKDSKVYYRVYSGIVNLKNQTVILIGKKKKNTRILKLKIK